MLSKICTIALASQVMGQETANLSEPVDMDMMNTNVDQDLIQTSKLTYVDWNGYPLQLRRWNSNPHLYFTNEGSDEDMQMIQTKLLDANGLGSWEVSIFKGKCGEISQYLKDKYRFRPRYRPCSTMRWNYTPITGFAQFQRDVGRALHSVKRPIDKLTRVPRREMEADLETVMKARIGNLMKPVNSFLQDIAPEFYNLDTCDVNTYVSCWMKRPSYERRRMMNQFWKMSDTYDPKDQCAKESGCMRPDASKTGDAGRQQGFLRDLAGQVDNELRPDIERVLNDFRNSVRDVVQRGAQRYIGQAQKKAVQLGCDAECIQRFNPMDLEAWTRDRCNCLKNIGQEENFVTNFEAADWNSYDLEDWLDGAEEKAQVVAESEYLQNLTKLDIAEEKAGFQMFYEL